MLLPKIFFQAISQPCFCYPKNEIVAHFYVAAKQIILRSAEVDDVNVFRQTRSLLYWLSEANATVYANTGQAFIFRFLCVRGDLLFINMGPLNCFDY